MKNGYAEYVPYLGKNECAIWWDNYLVHEYQYFVPDGPFKINSLFIKELPTSDNKNIQPFSPFIEVESGNSFSFFERLPISYDKQLLQYEYAQFAFSDWSFVESYKTKNSLLKTQNNEIIQVF